MNRVVAVKEKFGISHLQAHDIVKFVSEMIAEELTAEIDFVKSDGDLYELSNGLNRAVHKVKTYDTESW